jgi:hypothetical protein
MSGDTSDYLHWPTEHTFLATVHVPTPDFDAMPNRVGLATTPCSPEPRDSASLASLRLQLLLHIVLRHHQG